jgi:DNA-directed RNA polymerase specialized sigma24 family protein
MMKTRNVHGWFAWRSTKRLEREHLLFRAAMLPAAQRAMLVAHLDAGMKPDDIAALRGISVGTLRRKLRRYEDRLNDPAFLLAARFADLLEPPFRDLVHQYWVEGMSVRDIALTEGLSMHAVRCRLQISRALLLLEAKNETAVNPAEVCALLNGRSRKAS